MATLEGRGSARRDLISGGRQRLRAMLDVAARPALCAFYPRLVGAGKAKLLAISAGRGLDPCRDPVHGCEADQRLRRAWRWKAHSP